MAMTIPMLNVNLNNLRPFDGENNSNNNNNNNPTTMITRRSSKRCLFGSPDPQETYALLEKQLSDERERFYLKFGIYMEQLESVAVEQEEVVPSSSTKRSKDKLKCSAEKKARQFRILKPYNVQTKITDFCQIKKTSSLPKKC
ncbi:PREDICTED: uncharacterized protein LOC108558380 [Nicrophorus vespilloides]|uniref:Uncharacterized protein LOC108558380 n=1 Tax=Nicrophorus vespilloides TaxID=110193 RepID=A0ABM1M868_NICVS|nr:PREDICTED: uncharacterized protein LOC108558380 [Nicrophorus vespilloides]